MLVGLLVAGIVAWLTGVTEYQGFVSWPPSIGPTFLEFDLLAALQPDMAAGGRTGLTAVVTAALFFLALFFSPIVAMVGGGYQLSGTVTLYPVIAPALIVVGIMMLRNVRYIKWDDTTEAIPAFLTMLLMPLTVSITDGLAFGFISFAVLKISAGRASDVDWLIFLFASLFVLRYVFLV